MSRAKLVNIVEYMLGVNGLESSYEMARESAADMLLAISKR